MTVKKLTYKELASWFPTIESWNSLSKTADAYDTAQFEKNADASDFEWWGSFDGDDLVGAAAVNVGDGEIYLNEIMAKPGDGYGVKLIRALIKHYEDTVDNLKSIKFGAWSKNNQAGLESYYDKNFPEFKKSENSWGGSQYVKTYRDEEDMISEDTKVTLTLGQLRKLIESTIKDRNNNSFVVDDSELTIILKGTEESRDVRWSGFSLRTRIFHSLEAALEFCDKDHIGRDGIETIIVHQGDKTEERGPFFDGKILGTTNDWNKVKNIVKTLVKLVKKDLDVKKINENAKVTLTLGQLKKLVKEVTVAQQQQGKKPLADLITRNSDIFKGDPKNGRLCDNASDVLVRVKDASAFDGEVPKFYIECKTSISDDLDPNIHVKVIDGQVVFCRETELSLSNEDLKKAILSSGYSGKPLRVEVETASILDNLEKHGVWFLAYMTGVNEWKMIPTGLKALNDYSVGLDHENRRSKSVAKHFSHIPGITIVPREEFIAKHPVCFYSLDRNGKGTPHLG